MGIYEQPRIQFISCIEVSASVQELFLKIKDIVSSRSLMEVGKDGTGVVEG